jgi:tetratricopeptide (TPR) repeat protein
MVDGRLVFRRAGSHPGQVFALGAAAARCGLDEPATSVSLERLIEAFLVETPAPDRYRLHDLLRLFATERFATQESPDDRAACLAREIDWLVGLARGGGWTVDERDNVLSMMRAAVDADQPEGAWGLAEAVHPLLTSADDHTYRLRLWQGAEAAARALGDDLRRARALRWISHSYGMAGRPLRELPPAEEALALAERVGDPWEIAHAVRRLGEAMRSRYRFAEGEAALLRALDLFMELGDVTEEIEVRSALGTLYNNFRRHESSTPILERALELLPAEESARRGWVLLVLGLAYKFGGRREESRTLTERAFAIARRFGYDDMLGYCLQERAWFAEEDGRYDDAEQDFREMMVIFERIKHGGGVGGAHEGLGVVAMRQGRYDAALTAFDAGTAQYHRLHDRVREGELRLNRAAALRALGRDADAAAEKEQADKLIGDAPIHRGSGLTARLPEPRH